MTAASCVFHGGHPSNILLNSILTSAAKPNVICPLRVNDVKRAFMPRNADWRIVLVDAYDRASCGLIIADITHLRQLSKNG